MQKFEREHLNNQDQRRYIFLRFRKGCKAVFTDWRKTVVLVAYAILAIWLIDIDVMRDSVSSISYGYTGIFSILEMLRKMEQTLIQYVICLAFLLGAFLLLVSLGTPIGSRGMRDSFLRIGLINHAGEAPLLIGKSKDKTDKRITILEFVTHGIPLNKWQDTQLEIEATLNVNVVKVTAGKNKHYVLLHTIPAKYNLPEVIHWHDSYLDNYADRKGFILLLGESLLGVEEVDLSRTPHILLGGSTGSGKSVLLKLLLRQCVKKGALVTIADFKGGVDFSPEWHKQCEIIVNENILLEKLEELTQELERRKTLLAELGCANIDAYVKKTKSDLVRLIFACDEVAELLDKTGLDKEKKAIIVSIEGKISTLARLGRAFGIHLILATQRPDANILTGQVKNNLDYRVCGRADNTLSIIILDNGSASDMIPSDAQGRFINRDGTVFQAYWFDEELQ